MKDELNPNTRIHLPNLLLISGSGRNCGKTTFACKIIGQFSKTEPVIALKISPHFHQLNRKQVLIYQNEKMNMYREKDANSGKDSSRLLAAGATESVYLQCEDKNLVQALEILKEYLPANTPIVCESGSLAKFFKAGVHLMVEGDKPDKLKRSYKENRSVADRIIHFNGRNFNFELIDIEYNTEQWKLKKQNNDQFRRRA